LNLKDYFVLKKVEKNNITYLVHFRIYITRGDILKKRYEHKYILRYDQYLQLKKKISQLLSVDSNVNSAGYYKVNTLYFDDMYFSAASDKLFGESLHKKFRIRYYDENKKYKLERKIKVGDLCIKDNYQLNLDQYDLITNGKFILNNYKDNSIYGEFLKHAKLRMLKPQLLITYDREAFSDTNNQLRITFDQNIFTSTLNNYSMARRRVLSKNEVILEIKYTHYLPKEIQTILNMFSPQKISYSKYAKAFNILQN